MLAQVEQCGRQVFIPRCKQQVRWSDWPRQTTRTSTRHLRGVRVKTSRCCLLSPRCTRLSRLSPAPTRTVLGGSVTASARKKRPRGIATVPPPAAAAAARADWRAASDVGQGRMHGSASPPTTGKTPAGHAAALRMGMAETAGREADSKKETGVNVPLPGGAPRDVSVSGPYLRLE